MENMRRARLSKCCQRPRYPTCAFKSQRRTLTSVAQAVSRLERLDGEEFRRRAFVPEQPFLIVNNPDSDSNAPTASPIVAIRKWFNLQPNGRQILNFQYLEQFGDIALPYELMTSPKYDADNFERVGTLPRSLPDEPIFQRFHAPLHLFLTAARSSQPPQLYIAQAQLHSLPKQLQDDFPIPRIILEAGKGDIYDANIWMGIPPTYTPLHKDPNPNLFTQIASRKIIRLYKPEIGTAIFRNVQREIGGDGLAIFRGDEMMQGPERKALEYVVWDDPDDMEGYEAMVRPGDALFIPKGWWHSIKSIGDEINASVNWWFR